MDCKFNQNITQHKSQHLMKRIAFALLATALALVSLSCEEPDDNKLSSAQACLDSYRDSEPITKAEACADKLGGMTSPESYIIRCAVDFIVGGVTNSSLITAFTAYKGASTNDKAAILMTALAQTGVDPAAALANAAKTASDCKKSQIPGLDYLASMSQVGTELSQGNGPTTDPLTIAGYLTGCAGGGVCNDDVVGAAVISMVDVYCVGSAAKEQTCVEINSAINQAGDNPGAVAQALYDLLQ